MIFTSKQHIKRYLGIDENLDKAIAYILQHDLSQLPIGKTNICEEDVFVNVMEYVADNVLDAFYEAHQAYIDIHCVSKGIEKMSGVHIENTQESKSYDVVDDISLHQGKSEYTCLIQENQFLIVFPEDLHEPKIMHSNELIRKIVFKVRLANH